MDGTSSIRCNWLSAKVLTVWAFCRDLIERLITLGFYYRELDRFATVSRNLSWIRSANAAAAASPLERCSELAKRKDERPSVYRRAVANGIVEILSVYRSVVLQIEQKLLSETLPILATVTQGLNKVGYAIFLDYNGIFVRPPLKLLLNFSFLSFCLHYTSLLSKSNVRTSVVDNFWTSCTNGVIVEFLNCRRVFRGTVFAVSKASLCFSTVQAVFCCIKRRANCFKLLCFKRAECISWFYFFFYLKLQASVAWPPSHVQPTGFLDGLWYTSGPAEGVFH